MSKDFPLPDDLPVPEDDGAADHLQGMTMPDVSLPATDDTAVELRELPPRTVIYVYPLTGRPDEDVIPEGWEDVPGARGCTPESRGFRSHYDELRDAGVGDVFGLSTQSTAYQREARDRLHLPFELLSDAERELADALDLPTFTIEGEEYLKRLTMVVTDGRIEHVFYPIFPPDEHADEVLEWVSNASDS
ncbi:peroxiredoxin [Halopenitus persicus]|uniref:Peroxiredoxin n=1 Tax=Halopenitus persicus TaxID=1048396 RepID=A0A1H3HAP7_9EURY|nr:peroxiredoxin [Halopenitus persicus]QHS16039.1 peroxiredoxin [haloarchaeon 3A1-DGR]SDY12552.1 Peroxiredoxin [Halopenitus persicus]